MINNTWPHTRRRLLRGARHKPRTRKCEITAECWWALQEKGAGRKEAEDGEHLNEQQDVSGNKSAIALAVFTLWRGCEEMKLHLAGEGWWSVAGPAVIHTRFWQEKQSSDPSCSHSVCPNETLSSRSVCPELPLRSSECNLCWQKASVGIRSLSAASSIAPPRHSETSADSVPIADAPGAETRANRLDYWALKADSSKEKGCTKAPQWRAWLTLLILYLLECVLGLACMYTSAVCVRGREGQVGES